MRAEIWSAESSRRRVCERTDPRPDRWCSERAELWSAAAQATQAVSVSFVVGAMTISPVSIDNVGGSRHGPAGIHPGTLTLQAGFHVADVLGIDLLVLGNDDVAFTVSTSCPGCLPSDAGHQPVLAPPTPARRCRRRIGEPGSVSGVMPMASAGSSPASCGDWSRKYRISLASNSKSSHEPRVGDPCRRRAACRSWGLRSCAEEHAGRTLRCSCDDTRSVPLMMKERLRRHERNLAHVDSPASSHLLDCGLLARGPRYQAHAGASGAQKCPAVSAGALLHVEGGWPSV